MASISIEKILEKVPCLSYDPTRGEPYIALPAPHANIRLTPPRMTDAAAIVPILNDPIVYPMLEGPPYPYRPDDAEWWLSAGRAEYEAAMKQLEEMVTSGKEVLLGTAPFRILREVLPDGTETYLGDVGISRCNYEEMDDPICAAAVKAENDSKPLGDPTILWIFGDYLASSHHGRGIMTTAMRTLLHSWAIPYMGVRHVRGYVLIGNMGSRRVFEKLGFTLVNTVEGGVPTQGKREAEKGRWVLDYKVDA